MPESATGQRLIVKTRGAAAGADRNDDTGNA